MTPTKWTLASVASLLLLAGDIAGATDSPGNKASAMGAVSTPPVRPVTVTPAFGFRYIILSLKKIVVYADGSVTLIQGAEKKNYPRGTLLILEENNIRNMGTTSERNIATTLVSIGVAKDLADKATFLLKRQPRNKSYTCARDSISFEVLEMMGSLVGGSAGMLVFSNMGMSVTIPECAKS